MATKLSDVIQRGTHVARPAASLAGIQYFESDTGLLLRDNGSSWDSISLATLVTTKGDLLAGTASGAVARVGVGSDGLPLVADSSQASGLNYGGVVGGTAFAPSGLTGSVAASRYVGATASVAPTTGAHLLGDWVTTQDGKVFICTTAGTPGTWTQAGGSGTFTGEVAGTDFAPTGLTGSTAASRYVGATASGAPASGAHLLGDYVIDQTGFLYVCTTAGTPGTWTKVGGSSGAVTQIAQTTLGSDAASITLSSIPGTYTDLEITGVVRSAGSLRFPLLYMQVNTDTASNYFCSMLDGAVVTGNSSAAVAQFTVHKEVASSGFTAGAGTAFHLRLPLYASTTWLKGIIAQGITVEPNNTNTYQNVNSGIWKSTAAITSIKLYLSDATNLLAGSAVTLWGIT